MFAEITPYWLLYSLAWDAKDRQCECDPQHTCQQTDLCVTEYCVPCAARAWLEQHGDAE